MENFHKNQTKSLEYHTFLKTISNKLMFTDINRKNRKYIEKKGNKSLYFLDFRSDLEPDPDPYQNETDPQH